MFRSSSDGATGRCRKTSSIRFTPIPEGHPGLRAPGIKSGRRAAPPTLSARLGGHVTLEARADGEIAACFDGYSVGLGTFSAGAAERAQELRTGLPLASFASGSRTIDKEIDLLVRRLARRGLLEYRLAALAQTARTSSSSNRRLRIIGRERRSSTMPTRSCCRGSPIMRRRGNEMVLELPRAGALFKICDPKIAAAIAMLSTPQQIKQLRRQDGFPGIELLALLVDCQILFKIDAAGGDGLRLAEGDDNLVLWDFHDLLFHTRSTEGRHANPLGGVYPYAGVIAPLPAVRPRWPGKKIDLRKFSARACREAISPAAKLLRERHSTRNFDDQRPITLAELSRFLDGTARVLARSKSKPSSATAVRWSTYAARPYPSAGASLRARALSGRRSMRRACARILSLRRRRPRADADRRRARRSSKRCWRGRNLPWARPPRRRS